MTSATTSVSAVPVPRLCKNIQEVKATGKMRTCGSADFLDLQMTKPNYKRNTKPNSNPNVNPNTKQTLILI